MRRSRTPTAIAALLLTLASAASSQPANPGGDPARGAASAVLCNACHGPDGNASMAGVPSLAAQPEIYLVSQMILFREGLRKVPAMNAALASLDEKTIVDIAAYYAKQVAKPAADATGKRDAALYDRGALISRSASCGGCHLPDYRGRDNMPRLAGQREDYLAATMIEYRDNKRGGGDTTMVGILYGITDADVKALAHYLAQQK